MEGSFNKESKTIPSMEVRDKVRLQNQTTVKTTRWDKTGVITARKNIECMPLLGKHERRTVVFTFWSRTGVKILIWFMILRAQLILNGFATQFYIEKLRQMLNSHIVLKTKKADGV